MKMQPIETGEEESQPISDKSTAVRKLNTAYCIEKNQPSNNMKTMEFRLDMLINGY